MKVILNREPFAEALQLCEKVVQKKALKPILRNIKCVASKGTVTLSATDYEVSVSYRIDAADPESLEAGATILPTSEVVPIVRTLPDETVTLEVHHNDVMIIGESSVFSLLTESPDEFPSIEGLGVEPEIEIDAETLAAMIKRVIFAAAKDHGRYALCSVAARVEDERLNLAATDSRRLATICAPVTVHTNPREGDHLIPPKALALLQKTLADGGTVGVSLASNSAIFTLHEGRVTVVARLVEGRLPDYKAAMPESSEYDIGLPVGPLLTSLRQAKIVTNDDSRGVRFEFMPNLLLLHSRASSTGQSTVELSIEHEHEGDVVASTFDPQLIIEMLRTLDPESDVRLHITDGRRAAKFCTEDNYDYVVMPLTGDE